LIPAAGVAVGVVVVGEVVVIDLGAVDDPAVRTTTAADARRAIVVVAAPDDPRVDTPIRAGATGARTVVVHLKVAEHPTGCAVRADRRLLIAGPIVANLELGERHVRRTVTDDCDGGDVLAVEDRRADE